MAYIISRHRPRHKDIENEIRNMSPGQTGYAVPWAVTFDHLDRAYLRLDYDVLPYPGGTAEMSIKRIGPGRTDYEVDLSTTKNFFFGMDYKDKRYKWTRMDIKQIEAIDSFAYIGSLDDAVDGIIRPKPGEDDNNIWRNVDSADKNDPNDIRNATRQEEGIEYRVHKENERLAREEQRAKKPSKIFQRILGYIKR
jgi:hypothetical protein